LPLFVVGPILFVLMSPLFEIAQFPSEGALSRGRLYRPRGARPAPVVIRPHGTSTTISMVADHYAEVSKNAGRLDVLGGLIHEYRWAA